MMECWVRLGDGRELDLPTALEWEFRYGTGLPCDSFSLRCLWREGEEAVLSAAALFFAQWQGERMFTGVVDEFAVRRGGDGLYLELSGRGMAARLLDNEALPAAYQRATAADIIARHVTPYGIETVGGGQLPPVAGFTAGSGVSEWSVVEEFARYHGGIVPRFDRMGRLVLTGHDRAVKGRLDGSTPIVDWVYRETRYGVLSRVAVRRRSDWNTQWVEDGDFLAQGGCARRVVTVPNTAADTSMRFDGHSRLRASRRERVRLEVTAAGLLPLFPGDGVEVDRPGFGKNGLYRVAASGVRLDGDGLTTRLELGEPDSLI